MKTEQKQDWIFVAKGICIITVVLLHISCPFIKDTPFGTYLDRFGRYYQVAVFFCISGLTLKENKLNCTFYFILGKIKKLYTKIVLIGIAFVLLHNFFISIGFYDTEIIYSGKVMYKYGLLDIIKQCVLTLLMANREVLIGPMWFANVLFLAMIIESLLCFIIQKSRINNKREVRFILATILMVVSWVIGKYFGINIPRFNNVFSALFLIDGTQLLVTKFNFQFSNRRLFVCTLICCSVLPLIGTFGMNNNHIINPLVFAIASFSFSYVIFYVSKRIVWKCLICCGKHSFNIMAFQFLGFKLGACASGWGTSFMIPEADSIFALVYYFAWGVFVPILFSQIKRAFISFRNHYLEGV